MPALARAHWQVNEIITTLLLNFVAIQWVAWFSFDIWRDRAAAVVQSTPVVQRAAAVLPRLEHALRRHLRPADHRRRDVRRVPVDAVGLRGRHDRRQPAGGRVRRDPRDPPHRRRDADLRRDRRAVRDAPPRRAGAAAQLVDLQQLRALGLHRRRPRRQLRRRRRRRVGLHRRAAPRRDHAAGRRAVGVRRRRRVRPRAARHRRRRGRRPLPPRARRRRLEPAVAGHEPRSPTSSRRPCRRARAWPWPRRARCSTNGPAR